MLTLDMPTERAYNLHKNEDSFSFVQEIEADHKAQGAGFNGKDILIVIFPFYRYNKFY